jgi:hypothetical protein
MGIGNNNNHGRIHESAEKSGEESRVIDHIKNYSHNGLTGSISINFVEGQMRNIEMKVCERMPGRKNKG